MKTNRIADALPSFALWLLLCALIALIFADFFFGA
jgi:hypothetical protein